MKKFLIIVGVAFVLRSLLFIAVGFDNEFATTPDSQHYLQISKNLAEHGVFSRDKAAPFTPETIRTPGYPFFLSFFHGESGHSIQAIRWTQGFLDAITAGVTFLIGVCLWGSGPAALIAGLGMAVDFVVLHHPNFIITDSLFLFMFTLGLLGFAWSFKKKFQPPTLLLLSGTFFALAALVRPVGMFYFVFPMAILGWRFIQDRSKNNLLAIGFFLVGAIGPMFLWSARNKAQADTWAFSTIQGMERAIIVQEEIAGISREEAEPLMIKKFDEEHPEGFPTDADRQKAISQWATKFVITHPFAYFRVLIKGAIRLYGGNGMKSAAYFILKDKRYDHRTLPTHPTQSNWEQIKQLASRHPSLGVSLFVYLSFLAVTYVFMLWGLWTAWKEKNWLQGLLLFSILFYISGVSIGMGAYSRLRLPAMPAIFLLAGYGIATVLTKFRKTRSDNF